MSDFLARLARRQLGQIKTIEPRVTPLFGPTDAVLGAASMEIEQTAPYSTTSETARAEELPRIQQPVAPRSNRAGNATPPMDHAPMDHLDYTATPVLTRPLERSMADVPPASIGRAPETSKPPVTLAAPSAVASIEVLTVESAGSAELMAVSTAMNFSDGRMVAPPPLVMTREIRSSDGRAAAGKLTAPVDSISAANQSYPASARNSEQPVHVTIGRIEVTAVTAAPAQRRTATVRKPAMSLDDYLARRQRRES